MVYITGDTHGDITRFTTGAARRLKKGDTLLVCGDFGFLWNDSTEERRKLAKLKKLRYTIAFVDGAHENFALLNAYPTEEWQGGNTQRIADNIRHLLRGELYTIEGATYFTFGGGVSAEGDLRVDTADQLASEYAMPTQQELETGLKRLEDADNTVDYIITHQPSGKASGYFDASATMNGLHAYFNLLEEQVDYRCWFFGSLHVDKKFSHRHCALFSSLTLIS